MRIIAGKLGGRNFSSPKNSRTHPMSNKARGGLFNILGDIDGLKVLDAFAGSGALGLEAISRGASEVLAIDIDKLSTKSIKDSANSLGIEKKVKVIRANLSSWSENNIDSKFDLVLADPPFDDIKKNLLDNLTMHTKIAGIFVLAWPAKHQSPEFQNLKLLSSHNYGDIELLFFRR